MSTPEHDPCPYCGEPMDSYKAELVWFRDGRGWRHEHCARDALASLVRRTTDKAVR